MWKVILTIVAASSLCASGLAQCYINAQGQMTCPNRPAVYGVTHPFQQRVEVASPTIRYSTAAPQWVSAGECTCGPNCPCRNGGISNVRDITEQRNAELKELGQLRAYRKATTIELKAIRAECSALRAQAQPGAARVPMQEPARVGLPTGLKIPKLSLRLPPNLHLTLTRQTLVAKQ